MRAPTCRAEASARAPRITSAGASRCVRGWVEVSTRSCLNSIISEPLEGLSPGDDSGLREVDYCSTAATTDRGVPSRRDQHALLLDANPEHATTLVCRPRCLRD